MAQTLPIKLAMNFNDLTIIYLACGAPLGVYYFLQHRRNTNRQSLWLKTFVNFLFWMPFAFRLLWQNKIFQKLFRTVFDRQAVSDATIEKLIAPLRKQLETSIVNSIPQNAENIPQMSVFEIREIFDRYIGLTLACQIERENSQSDRTENKFYKISGHKNARLASICSARRNRQRLFFHQTEARRDFLNLINETNGEHFRKETIEFAKLLNDLEAKNALEKMFAPTAQTEKLSSVKDTEKDLWKSETHKPLAVSQSASTHLKLSARMMSLRAKD